MPAKPKTPTPRASNFMGMRSQPTTRGETWLEPEELCYPSGRLLRRCRARCADGRLRVVVCGIPDTAFSIPARAKIEGRSVRGFVSADGAGEFMFTAYTKERITENAASA